MPLENNMPLMTEESRRCVFFPQRISRSRPMPGSGNLWGGESSEYMRSRRTRGIFYRGKTWDAHSRVLWRISLLPLFSFTSDAAHAPCFSLTPGRGRQLPCPPERSHARCETALTGNGSRPLRYRTFLWRPRFRGWSPARFRDDGGLRRYGPDT